MAYEFVAEIGEKDWPSLRRLGECLVREGLCVVEETPEAEALLHLRWAETERRVTWPEDVSVSFVERGVLVSFYTATGAQRDTLLRRIERFVAEETGAAASFAEV